MNVQGNAQERAYIELSPEREGPSCVRSCAGIEMHAISGRYFTLIRPDGCFKARENDIRKGRFLFNGSLLNPQIKKL